jgi:inorganic pyrophosphatase
VFVTVELSWSASERPAYGCLRCSFMRRTG